MSTPSSAPSLASIAGTPAEWHPDRAVTADYSGRSNLALAFLCLPREKREEMNVFYTFCRLVDDIADTSALPAEEKSALLKAWRAALSDPGSESPPVPRQGGGLLSRQLRALMATHGMAPTHFLEIIDGVEMDVAGQCYATFEELRGYCYRVASAVGLVSIEIFGYRDERTREYALDLGLALQLTNIIRDVGVDLDNGGRIYLPLEDLERFGYTPEDLRQRVDDRRFEALMEFEAERAEGFYRSAVAHLGTTDRRSMVAAEIMREVYWKLLADIRRDGYRVFAKRYRLSKPRKLWTLLTTVVKNRFG